MIIAQVEDVHNVEIRDDDVMLISYPKSGCHWLNEIASMLLAGTPEAEVRMITTTSSTTIMKMMTTIISTFIDDYDRQN